RPPAAHERAAPGGVAAKAGGRAGPGRHAGGRGLAHVAGRRGAVRPQPARRRRGRTLHPPARQGDPARTGHRPDLGHPRTRRAPPRAAGLTTVDPQTHVPVWAAGDPGALLLSVDVVRHRRRFVAAGMTLAELDRVRQLVTDPGSGLLLRGHPLYSTSGPARPW